MGIQRLHANGSDTISGITFDGYSYNWELKQGKAVKLNNVTSGERAQIRDGIIRVTLPDSTAAVLNF